MPTDTQFPGSWQMLEEYDPQKHLIQLKGRDYLNVQNRLLWFIRDQRALIVAGLAKVPYTIQTELVELDREQGWAHYKTFIRDVLNNEVLMYGSEAARDFPDFIEKASTKSLGRALLLLGYGTAFAEELDEGERVVDAPVTPVRSSNPSRSVNVTPSPASNVEPMATERQINSIRKLCLVLGREEPEVAALTFNAARELLTHLSHAYSDTRQTDTAQAGVSESEETPVPVLPQEARATAAQLSAIRRICENLHRDVPANLDMMTLNQASVFLSELQVAVATIAS